ncbi:MAG: DNA polymerase III subunit beta [Patescibacteria group bacterium]|nr:DNA polymerase III subunit beta [Patescibacteria group bacterium]
MKVEVNQEDLVQKLAICSRFTTSKVQLPILANVLITATSNKITLKATNLESSISFSMGSKVIEEGSITIPSKTFYEIVSNLSKGVLTLVAEKEQLHIFQEGYNALLVGINSLDFPDVISTPPKEGMSFQGKEAIEIFQNVLFSVSSDEARPVLNGVLFIFDDQENIVFVSTDGFRLTKFVKNIKKENKNVNKLSGRIIIPKSTLVEVSKIFQENTFTLSLIEKDKQVVFSDGLSCVLSSRIIEGEFPNFEKILPKESKLTLNVSRDDFYQAIRLASVFAKDSSNVVTFDIKKDDMFVKSENSTTGKQSKRIFFKRVEGTEEEMKISFNFHFLDDLLKVIKGESLEIRISSPFSPVLFLDPICKEFIHVIMPIKTL